MPILIFIGGALLTALGWVAGWQTTKAAENRKRKHEKVAQREDYQRQAAEMALAWIDPMNLALTRVESDVTGFLFQRVDGDHFRERWPKSLSAELESLDLPPHLRVYLADGAQSQGVEILGMFNNLYYKALAVDRADLDQVFSAMGDIFEIRKAIDQLRTKLESAHRMTFE